jgi:hypothetical protein
MRRIPGLVPLFALLLVVGCARPGTQLDPGLDLFPPPPAGMSEEAWIQAHTAFSRVREEGRALRAVLAIIDYSLPSSEPRLWVVDPQADTVIARDYVAHGWASGSTFPYQFSNRWGSNQSSLGVFLTREAYSGVRGISLRLEGIEPGINDRALARGIVVHGSPFVSAIRASQGNLGRTEGCPAVPMSSARRLVHLLEGGAVVFAWYPDPDYLDRSRYLDRQRIAN